MHTVTVRDLRNNFPQIAAWLEAGEPIKLTRRGKVLGTINPEVKKKATVWPDFAARHKALWGDKVFGAEETAQWLRDTRGDRS